MAHQERKKIMKTWKKIVLGVSLISLFLGGGLVAWGYSQGGLTDLDRKSTRLNSSHLKLSRMPSSA